PRQPHAPLLHGPAQALGQPLLPRRPLRAGRAGRPVEAAVERGVRAGAGDTAAGVTARRVYRLATTTRRGCFGRSVMVGCSAGSFASVSLMPQRRATAAMISVASILAKNSPMQLRAPPPKGK